MALAYLEFTGVLSIGHLLEDLRDILLTDAVLDEDDIRQSLQVFSEQVHHDVDSKDKAASDLM